METNQIQWEEKKSSSVKFVTIPIGSPTRNNRVYPREVMEKALKDYQKQIDQRRAFVTLYNESNQIFIKDIVALVNEVKIENDELVIKVEVLDTQAMKSLALPDGKLDATLIKIAPFGVGSLKENVVQDDFQIVGFHIDPNYER
jgi:hypothetical protein